MKLNLIRNKITALLLGGVMTMALPGVAVYADNITPLPSAGADFFLADEGKSVKDVKDETDSSSRIGKADKSQTETEAGVSVTTASPSSTATATSTITPAISSADEIVTEETGEEKENKIEETKIVTTEKTVNEKEREIDAKREEESFKNLVIADVSNYVNIRKGPSEEEEKVGKLYDKSVGEFISEQDGWYEIKSGSVTGFVKGEYCITGDAAVQRAKEVGERIATVNTTTLKVRGDASTDAEVLGLVPDGEELTVLEELDGWVKVAIEEGDGYVSLDYVKLSTRFVKAESREEEEARLAKEKKEREAAIEAANKATANNKKNNDSNANSNSGSGKKQQTVYASGGSELGRSVANYALQFLGNPYVYGGSSLTNGTDCSGFVMSVYKNFGVSLPHSSTADRSQGYAVGSLSEAQPGDLVCYSGHVGLYIGNGQIVHASTAKTGIIISNANYHTILAIRRIF